MPATYKSRTRVYHTIVGESEELYLDTGWLTVVLGNMYNVSGSSVSVTDTHAVGSYSNPLVRLTSGSYSVEGNDLIMVSGSAWAYDDQIPRLFNSAITESGHTANLVGTDQPFTIRTVVDGQIQFD